ncbi:RAD55 family ATPase [Halobacteriales archaeon Cl-PHB]
MTDVGSAVESTTGDYDLPDELATDRDVRFPAGSNVLLAGPSMTDKRRMAMELLAHGEARNQAVILVSTDAPTPALLAEFHAQGFGPDATVAVVDCYGTTGVRSETDADFVERVSSPADLTGIGIGLAKSMQAVGDRAAAGLRLGVVSLSTMLQYTGLRRVFDFAHIVGGRAAAAGYLSVWTLDTDVHEPRTVNTLKSRFDYVVEIRETESGRREERVLGGPAEWRTWEPL